MICDKQLLRAMDGRLLDHVSPFAAAVISFAGIAFSVLVGEDGAHRFEHSFAHKIFAGDQFQSISLTGNFIIDRVGDLWIDFGERKV